MEYNNELQDAPVGKLKLWWLKTFGGRHTINGHNGFVTSEWSYPGELWLWFKRIPWKSELFLIRFTLWWSRFGKKNVVGVIRLDIGSEIRMYFYKPLVIGEILRVGNLDLIVSAKIELRWYQKALLYIGFKYPSFILKQYGK